MSNHGTPDPAPEVDFNSYGLHVGQAIREISEGERRCYCTRAGP